MAFMMCEAAHWGKRVHDKPLNLYMLSCNNAPTSNIISPTSPPEQCGDLKNRNLNAQHVAWAS